MLRLKQIDAGYSGTQVLWDVGLEAKQGEMTVIIGPNGAGKSTILKVVNGLLRPTRGKVLFAGDDITNFPAYERPARGIASCPEGLLRHRSGIERVREKLKDAAGNANDFARLPR